MSTASVSRWWVRERELGAPRPKALGGDRRSDRIEAHHDLVLSALGPNRDAVIEEVRASLSVKGLVFGYGAMQRFFARHDVTRKQDDLGDAPSGGPEPAVGSQKIGRERGQGSQGGGQSGRCRADRRSTRESAPEPCVQREPVPPSTLAAPPFAVLT